MKTTFLNFQCFDQFKKFWKCYRQSYANIGGLACLVFHLRRSSAEVTNDVLEKVLKRKDGSERQFAKKKTSSESEVKE